MTTTFANNKGVATKASKGLTMAFPDVCTVPAPPSGPGGVPIPYPNIATTAQKKQALKQKTVAVQGGSFSLSRGDEAGTLKGMASLKTPGSMTLSPAAKAEIGQIKSSLSTLNAKLQGLPAKDPNAWQAVLADYLVLASALYLAQSDD